MVPAHSFRRVPRFTPPTSLLTHIISNKMGGAAATVPAAGPVVGETGFFKKANAKPLFYAAIAVFGAILYGECDDLGKTQTSRVQPRLTCRGFQVMTVPTSHPSSR